MSVFSRTKAEVDHLARAVATSEAAVSTFTFAKASLHDANDVIDDVENEARAALAAAQARVSAAQKARADNEHVIAQIEALLGIGGKA